MCDSLQPHGLQYTRLPCPSLSPDVCSNSCPLSQWCHPTISFSVASFSSCPQSFLESGSFPMSQFFASFFFFYFAVLLMVHWNSIASSNLSVRASASASVLPNIWGWFPLGLTGLIFLLSKGLSRVFSSTMTSMLCNNCLFFSRTLALGALLWLSHQVVYDSLAIWDSPGKNTGVGCHFLLQGSFLSVIEPTHPAVSSAAFPALQAGSLLLSHLGSPKGDYFR